VSAELLPKCCGFITGTTTLLANLGYAQTNVKLIVKRVKAYSPMACGPRNDTVDTHSAVQETTGRSPAPVHEHRQTTGTRGTVFITQMSKNYSVRSGHLALEHGMSEH